MIHTVQDRKRGCGWRKPGGLYLRLDGLGMSCGALPIALTVCPTCGEGIKPSRGWTWINLATIGAERQCHREGGCGICPLADARIQRAGLLWVGEKFYTTPAAWSEEAAHLGISRRIPAVPHDFVVGETWVAMAHRKAIVRVGDPEHPVAGIFHVFRPDRIEYVVKGDETEEQIDRMEKRGITAVQIEQVAEQSPLAMAD